MADSVSSRNSLDAGTSTASLTGSTTPMARGEGDEFVIAMTGADSSSGSDLGKTPSSQLRGSPLLDDQKTVISKKSPVVEQVALPRAITPAEMGRTLVGQRLGHFELEEFVGGGGMGAVFRATDTMLNRTVAVKVLSRDQTEDETLKRFKNEAQNAARLDHEKIARVYYVGEDQGWHYIVFEFIDGVNLRDLVDDKGPLALDEAVYYTLQVAEALRHAHHRDVVHRDIKPSNILITPDGRAKLVDMGLARLHQVESPQNDLTASGVTLGTFDYISPEQARDPRNADVRSDIYSLGCTLYFALTGRPPFPDGTVLQKLLSHSTDAPPDPRLYRPDIPDDVCRTLTRMLAKNPTQRFQSPDELIEELLEVADRQGLETAAHSGTPYSARPAPRAAWYEQHLPWAAPVVTLIVVVLLLDWLSNSRQTTQERPRPKLLPAISAAPTNTSDSTTPPERVTPLLHERTSPKVVETPDGSATEVASLTPLTEVVESPTKNGTLPAATAVAGGATEPATSAGIGETPIKGGVDGADSGSSTAASATAPLAKRLLLVGPSTTPHGPQAKVVSSLAAAIAAAADMPDLEAIELHFDGERVEVPLSIAPTTLTIRAAAGRTPVIVFRPHAEALASDRHMLRIAGGRTLLQGIQFRLELPTQHAGEGWALFALDQIRSLEMERCGLTIRNATDLGTVLQSQVAFVELLSPRITTQANLPTESSTIIVPPLIQLSATIARGEANFIHAESGTPFALRWNQGLLATNQRLADIGGASDSQIWDSWVRIDLANLTAAVREGLCVMRARPDALKHLALEIDATNCIFVTDTTAPLIEHQTLEALDRLKTRHPNFEGRGNIFSGPREFWRIVSQRDTEPAEATFAAGFNTQDSSYGFNEPVLLKAVMWKALPAPSRAVHTHLKSDYLLSDDPQNPALRHGDDIAGFDPAAVPEFQAEVKSVPTTTPAPEVPAEKPTSETKPPMAPPMAPGSAAQPEDMKTPEMKPADMRMPVMRDPSMTTPMIPPR